ncbi:hypothetical protein BEWA_030430 [Theileria equi strain WA]|uniref:Uncharacterized protein n=1 Tax=Theileria equi strain WA TaxID=1537102 RepID=L0AX99_THEEQ|nr:hypothetical protein BEWA_030430 [Theileria equi strain WA]AFZ80190.1 hypothetical protein BEWA_030430 [Theileria equi strain WA]|eukprot:XP_004829856.1 hypothetical protein BEWA_030430 [Theileria equi strain WA]
MQSNLTLLKSTLSRVKDAALKFKNPGFSSYFFQKAEDNLKILEAKGDSVCPQEVQKLLQEYQELEQILNRQTTVQNLYYNDQPMVDK